MAYHLSHVTIVWNNHVGHVTFVDMIGQMSQRLVPPSRQQRIAEIMALQQKAKFGSVKEISAVDYVDEVNKAGEGVWVVLHLYQTGYPSTLCGHEIVWAVYVTLYWRNYGVRL